MNSSKLNSLAFHKVVETICAKTGCEKKKIASDLGVAPSYLSMLLSGKRNVSGAMVLRVNELAKRYGVSLTESGEIGIALDSQTKSALAVIANEMGLGEAEALRALIRRRASEILEQ